MGTPTDTDHDMHMDNTASANNYGMWKMQLCTCAWYKATMLCDSCNKVEHFTEVCRAKHTAVKTVDELGQWLAVLDEEDEMDKDL